MKKGKLIVLGGLALLLGFASCTENFDEINTNQQGFTSDEVSAKFFLTSSQVGLYAPNRFAYWRAQLIHSDRFAGHYTFGHTSSWWSDGLCYNFNASYTDATYGWMSGFFGNIKSFGDLTKEGGEFENQYMYAMSLIMKGLYYQMYTDTFGMVPYSEAGVDGILTPKYDAQKDIYKGIIAELEQAMQIIGDETATGVGVDDVGENDVYCGGDLQKWKQLANTLKLRIAMRALGAPGDDFAAAAIQSAMAAPLLDDASGSVIMERDLVISKWAAGGYTDPWNDFGEASNWTVSDVLINMLKDNNDPRLTRYARPAAGGEFKFVNNTDPETGEYTDPNYQDRVDFILGALDNAGANYTTSVDGNTTTVNVASGQFIGQPVRINGDTKSFVPYDMFSIPAERIVLPRGQQVESYPEIVLSSAESYFLQAEAAVRGMGEGDAQTLFANGIKEAMNLWGISGGDADAYIASADIADISAGSMEEKIEKIALQRWLASYTDGFEAWAVVRKYNYPSELAAGVDDPIIFALGELNGLYPQRMRYGSGAQDNPNYADAISQQGEDAQKTTLWFAEE
jgi:hypothetical protein